MKQAHRFTVMPFLMAILIAVAGMPTDVVQVNYGEMGTEHTLPWRSKALSAVRTTGRTLISRLRAMTTDWRGHPLAMPAAMLATALLISVIAPAHLHGSHFAIVGAVNFKQLLQDEADNKAAQAKVKADLGKLLDVTAKDRTDAQKADMSAKKTELTALEADAVTIAEDLALARKLQNDQKAAGSVSLGHNHAEDRPWGPVVAADAPEYIRREARHLALGNFAQSVRLAALGQGIADPRLQAAATGAGTQVDSAEGFAVPNEVAPGIEREMYTNGEVLSRVDARTITSNNMTYNVFDETSRADGSRGGGILGYWVDEGVAPTASNTKRAKIEMKLRKCGTLGVMTDELLSDAMALGGELEQGFSDELIFQVENRIYRGNGASAPLGFLNAPCLVSVAKESGQSAGTINTTNISKMWARLPSRSKRNSVWLYNTECNPQLDELSQVIGTGGTAPRFVTYSSDGVLMIKGRPAIEVEYAEAVGTVGDFALVDLAKYRLIRKGGVEQASSMHVYFSTGEQAFRAFYRVDGQPVPRAAITPFKGTATLSPFVVLATRA